MKESVMLLPKTENSPAKIKDPGVINLAKAGAVAYNAKNGELLLLPSAERQRRKLVSLLKERLFQEAGLQLVDCGNDAAVFSLAERYVRDWGETARFFLEERGRDIHILGWFETTEEATAVVDRVKRAILDETSESGMNFNFAEEIGEHGSVSSVLLSPAEPGSLRARSGFVCDACGRLLLPDSLVDFCDVQPGSDEEEEELEDIPTPGANTILELCRQLDIDIKRTIKAMLYVAFDGERRTRPVAAFLRGDFNVSMNKLYSWLHRKKGLVDLRTAEKQELQELLGEVAGYCGPVGMPENAIVVCDASVKGAKNAVVGANRPGFHRKGCCHGRDFNYPLADIAQNTEGVLCSCGKGTLLAATLRDSGRITLFDRRLGQGESKGKNASKMLVCRRRDGVVEYSIELRGVFSLESMLLSAEGDHYKRG